MGPGEKASVVFGLAAFIMIALATWYLFANDPEEDDSDDRPGVRD